MKPKAIVLLSGGLDSCTACAIARQAVGSIHCLNVYYGQRHSRERKSALAIANHYDVPLSTLDILGFGATMRNATVLTNPTAPLPDRALEAMSEGKAPSYVPGRNTVMLALAQAVAEAEGADVIYCGINALDYSGYVDCRPEFVAAWNQLAQFSTFRAIEGSPIWVEAPLVEMSKVQIVQKALELNAPLHLTWSCYAGQTQPCGRCDSCKIRAAAFEELGMRDPAEAEEEPNEVQHSNH